MPIKRIQQTVPLRILDWQRCVGLFLEGFSLLCELHGAQVPEGRVEPLVCVLASWRPLCERCFSAV